MPEITIAEAKDMDFVLNELLKLKAAHSNVVEVGYIWRKFLNEKGEYYSTDLIYKILDHEPKVLITDKRSGIKTNVWPTPLLDNFLAKGGFVQVANAQAQLHESKKELEKLTLEKARYDVKNAKRIYRTYWWTFTFSLIALIVSLILLILKLYER